MARIRTIKPEFWDSPDTAKAGPWARLLFIALWNWADDYGRGTANMKELEGFAFPNDDQFTDRSGNTVQFRDLVAEVSECFGVLFYTVDGRPFYAIPSWEQHQRNERRAKQSKYPSPQVRDGVAEIPCNDTEIPNSSGPGTGEEGKRGTDIFREVAEPKPPAQKKKPATRLPEAWEPTAAHAKKAQELGVDLALEAEKFRNHAEANDRKQASWNAAFSNWLIQSRSYQPARQLQAAAANSLWTREGPF